MSDDLELNGRRALVTRCSRPSISNGEESGPHPTLSLGERSACDRTTVRDAFRCGGSGGIVEAVVPSQAASASPQNKSFA